MIPIYEYTCLFQERCIRRTSLHVKGRDVCRVTCAPPPPRPRFLFVSPSSPTIRCTECTGAFFIIKKTYIFLHRFWYCFLLLLLLCSLSRLGGSTRTSSQTPTSTFRISSSRYINRDRSGWVGNTNATAVFGPPIRADVWMVRIRAQSIVVWFM